MAYRAVLFDVGGPIDLEIRHEQLVDRDIVSALAGAGVSVSADDLKAASDRAVASFAPDAYVAMILTLAGGDARVASEAVARFRARGASESRVEERGGLELRPGMAELLRGLRERELLLGLAANQPARVIAELERHGICDVFGHREVSGHHGFRKPDVRLFLRACEDLGVEPRECIMVGDRIDNDIFPAKLLGMAAILLRTGRHIAQEPRTLEEIPDAEVADVAEMAEALNRLLERGPSGG